MEEKETMETCLAQLIEYKNQLHTKNQEIQHLENKLGQVEEVVQLGSEEKEVLVSKVRELQAALDSFQQQRDELASQLSKPEDKEMVMEESAHRVKEEESLVQSESVSLNSDLVNLKELFNSKEKEVDDLRNIVEHLKRVNEDLNKSSEEQMEQLEVKLLAKEEELVEASRKLEESQTVRDGDVLNEYKSKFEQEKDELLAKLETTSAENVSLKNELSEGAAKYSDLSSEYENVKVDLERTKDDLNLRDTQMESLQAEVSELTNVIKESVTASQNDNCWT